MKNRTITGIAMLCLAFSTSLISCKKDDVSTPVVTDNSGAATQSSDLNEDHGFDDGNLTVVGDVSAAGNLATGDNNSDNMLAATAAHVRKNLLFDFNSENTNALTSLGNGLTTWASLHKCCNYSIQRSSTYARVGSYSTRYELNKTDAIVDASKRTESMRYSKAETNPYVERWYAASYFLPSDYVNDAAAECPTQWPTTQTFYPPLALWTQNGQWKLVQFGNAVTVLSNYDKNKWTDFVFHVKWSSGSTGLLEVWKNGTKILTKTGKNIDAGLTYGVYFKTGIYKWPWNSTAGNTSTTSKRVLYIDDVRVGNELANYYDVRPGA